MPVNATGSVTIEINGKSYTNSTIINGKATFIVPDLAYGNKTVAVTYSGDANYTSVFTTANFTVNKRQSYVNVSVSDIHVGEIALVNVTVPGNATGQVVVSVNGANYTVNVTEGRGTVQVKCLGSGTYALNVTYVGDDQYFSSNNDTVTLTVSKLQPVFEVNGSEITYGDDEFITIETAENITGLIKVEIGNKNYTAFISNGRGNLTVDNLAAGQYNVTVYFDGNHKYLNATANNTFTVNKATIPVIVVPQNITFGDEEIITVYVDATGTVDITVDGVTYSDIEIIDGKAQKELSGYLYPGNYTVSARYNGNQNYTESDGKANFTVSKKDPAITVEVQNITYGEVEHIIVRVNASGNVTIKVNGTVRTVVLSEDDTAVIILRSSVNALPTYDGRAHEYVYGLDVGAYSVEVTYNGNEFYNEATADALFFVNKANTTVKVDVADIKAGEKEIINVTIDNVNATGNVVINVDGINYTRPIANGTANLTLDNVSNGTHSVVVIYRGDDNLRGNWTSGIFEVTKTRPEITVDVNNTFVGETAKIVVSLPENATGFVVIDVDGTKYHVDIAEGQQNVTLEVDNLRNKTYEVTAEYSGNDFYESASASNSFNVSKVKADISVEVDDITVGDNAVINITVPEDLLGNVTVSVDGENHTVSVSGGHGTLVLSDVGVGNHTVDVVFDGSEKYEPAGNSTEFRVSKEDITPEIVVVDQGNGTVVVVVPGNATGNVTITVDNKTFEAPVVNGTAIVTLENVTPGKQNITVIYSGDGNHTNGTVNSTAVIPKLTTPIGVNVTDIKVGENATLIITVPENATGNVTVRIDGQTYTGEIVNGKANITVENLTIGNKTAIVEYSGDDSYGANYTVVNFTVEKVKVVPDIRVIDQGNGTVVVVVPGDATGNVTITVDNKTFEAPVVNGTAIVTLDNVTPGTQDITVFYSGDDNYLNSTVNSTVNIPKLDTPIGIEVSDIYVGDVARINVTVGENVTGEVRIEIDGKEYFSEVENGVARFEIENLTAGTKTVCASFIENGNHTANHTSANFTVFKHAPAITVNAADASVGDKLLINVTAPDDVTRPVIVNVDGVDYAVNITDGIGQLYVPNLVSGNYSITAKYLGDDKYLPANSTTDVEVSKVPSNITVSVENITVGDKAVIEITVPDDATGNVTVTVDGKDYNVSVANGRGILVVDGLKVGNYTVDVKYLGDDKYEPSTNATEFEVNSIETEIVVVDQGNGTVVVVVAGNATGNVTIKVGNDTVEAPLVNGTAVVTLDNLTPGTNDIEVIYSGDDTHANATLNATVIGPKYGAPMNVTTEIAKVGEDTVITVTVPGDATGNVTIEIDGVKYTSEVRNGNATFVVGNLTAGTKTIVIDYEGDDNYVANHTTANLTVSKVPSTVSATIEDINVGENVTVVVTVPKDATGQVLVDIDGVGYYVNVTNGTGSVQIPRMPSGVYNVNLTYVGDDRYEPAFNGTVFDVNKVPSYVVPTAKNITVGENAIIVFAVPDDATGNITVVINGEGFTFDLDEILGVPIYHDGEFSVAVDSGKGVLVISGLPQGEYDVEVTYNGNYKYLKSSNSTSFKVGVADCDINVVDQGNGTVVVIVSDNATGNITIKIENETYTGKIVNGTAVIDLVNATPGKHDIEVIYSGDDSHGSKTVNSTVEIPKKITPISVTAHDIYVGDTEHIVVTVPDDATGNITIEINSVPYTAPIIDGKAVFDVEGLAFGNKTVAVTYLGDDNYVQNFTTGQFEVKKRPSTVKATSKDISAGNDEVITVTVPKDATGRVIVKIGDVEYAGEIINGKARVVIPNLPSGNYKASVIYEGDDKYLPSSTTTSFKVTKVSTPISATGDYIEVGDDGDVVVNLPEDATGTVTIVVEGKTYTSPVIEGKSVFSVPGLSVGTHTVLVYYSGDGKYEANETVTSIVVVDNSHNKEPERVSASSEGVKLSDYPTGNPIFALLLIVLAIGSTQIRRFKK